MVEMRELFINPKTQEVYSDFLSNGKLLLHKSELDLYCDIVAKSNTRENIMFNETHIKEITPAENYVFCNNYGEMLAQLKSGELIEYREIGKYQGTYIAFIRTEKCVEVFIGEFGSCSGCDWLESEGHGRYDVEIRENEQIKEADIKNHHHFVPIQKAIDFCSQSVPRYIVPESMLDDLKLLLEQETDSYNLLLL